MSAVVVNRDCIVESGVKYCETNNITPSEWGIGILTTLLFVCYLLTLVWLVVEKEFNPFIVGGIGLVIPAILIAITLIVWY